MKVLTITLLGCAAGMAAHLNVSSSWKAVAIGALTGIAFVLGQFFPFKAR